MNDVPIVLFGAFDRHNLGDFLLARAAVQRIGMRPYLLAGLRAVDLTACGGFVVEPIGQVVTGWRQRYGDSPMDLVHVGGEILDTDAWEAAVMLLDAGRAAEIVARLDKDIAGRSAWAAQFVERGSPAPYVLGRSELMHPGRLEFRAVGGVGLMQRDSLFRDAVVGALAAADYVTVRDWRTQAVLADQGIRVELEPDPVAALGPWIAEEVDDVPSDGDDYIAVQFAASFADDATLETMAAALNALLLPVVLFRAGAAPWHDDLEVYGRLLSRLRGPARIIDSLRVRDIGAVIARAKLCLASSLHAVLVAGLFGVPAVGLERSFGDGEKLWAYAETWGGFDVGTPDALIGHLA